MTALKQISSYQNRSLFPLAPRFRIAKIEDTDAKRVTDNLKTLRSLIVSSEGMYPAIGRWFVEKVVPGLRTRERLGYVAYEGEKPIASAVLKLGPRSKFCHL